MLRSDPAVGILTCARLGNTFGGDGCSPTCECEDDPCRFTLNPAVDLASVIDHLTPGATVLLVAGTYTGRYTHVHLCMMNLFLNKHIHILLKKLNMGTVHGILAFEPAFVMRQTICTQLCLRARSLSSLFPSLSLSLSLLSLFSSLLSRSFSLSQANHTHKQVCVICVFVYVCVYVWYLCVCVCVCVPACHTSANVVDGTSHLSNNSNHMHTLIHIVCIHVFAQHAYTNH